MYACCLCAGESWSIFVNTFISISFYLFCLLCLSTQSWCCYHLLVDGPVNMESFILHFCYIMILCPPSIYLRPAQGRRRFRPLTLVQPSSGKYLTCLSFLFESLNVPVSWSVTLTHCASSLINHVSSFTNKFAKLLFCFSRLHISFFIPGYFPAQRQPTSLSIPVFIFSFLFLSKPQA